MLPDGLAVSHGEAAADPLPGHGPEVPASAEALCGAAKRNIALTGILPDSVDMNRGVICKGTLPHLLRLAGSMAGFPLSSGVDCDSKTTPERGAS